MNFTYPLIGGLLIGLSASLLMISHGKVCGLSGIFSNLISNPRQWWRWFFIGGFLVGSLLMLSQFPAFVNTYVFSLSTPLTIISGLLVGIGTRIGGGCTSGHGICGISRLSKRSIVATLLFISSAMVTVLIRRIVG